MDRTEQFQMPKKTLYQNIIPLGYIFQPQKQDFGEWANHGKDHPYIDHLDVRGAWKCLTDSNETERMILVEFYLKDKSNLQCGQNKHDCQMNLNNHVKILVLESVCHVAHKDQHHSGQSDLA